jgi:hypothetical protein
VKRGGRIAAVVMRDKKSNRSAGGFIAKRLATYHVATQKSIDPFRKKECLGLLSPKKQSIALKAKMLLASYCLTFDQQFPKFVVPERF